METKKTQDKIDLELSRAYFGNAPKPVEIKPKEEPKDQPENEAKPSEAEAKEPKEKQKKQQPKKKSKKPLLISLIIFGIFLGGFALGVAYFSSQDQVNLSIDVKPLIQNLKPILKPSSKVVVAVEETAPKFSDWGKHEVPQGANGLEGGKTLYDFEMDDNGWEIPSWAMDKIDHVAMSMEPVEGASSKGTGSLGVYVEFPGNKWSAALIEILHYLDLTAYDMISADIYLPPDCPVGLRAKIILTVGDSWKFTEMTRTTRLRPGHWNTITADISEGNTTTWRRTTVDGEFKSDIRKVAIRVESNKPAYTGPIYIDNITIYPIGTAAAQQKSKK
ncbi:hypothetical protein ACFL5E_02945 [Candidatus Omnitrophota bacterium]